MSCGVWGVTQFETIVLYEKPQRHVPPWNEPCEKICSGDASGMSGWPACIGSLRSWMRSAVITAFDVSGPGTSYGLKLWSAAYTIPNCLFCVTDTVDVDGAMFDETMHPASRASIARQCWSRFASA